MRIYPRSSATVVDANGIPQRSIWERQKKDPLNFTDLVLGGIFITIGIIVLLFGAKEYLDTKALYSDGERTIATVVDQNIRTYRDSEGHDRTSTTSILNYNDSTGATHELRTQQSLSVGSTVTVIYNPQSPGAAALLSERPYLLSTMLLISGLLVFCFAIFGLLRAFFKRKRALELLSNGKKVMAKIVAINNKPIYTVRRRGGRQRAGSLFSTGGISNWTNHGEITGHISEIFATWSDVDSGMEHSFRSYQIKDYLDPQLAGKLVPVFIDPANPSNYYLSGRCLAELRDSSEENGPNKIGNTTSKSEKGELSSSKPLF